MNARVSSIFLANIQTDNVRYRQIPTAAAGKALADDAAWVEIVDNTIMTTNWWLACLNIGVPAAGITADTEEVIQFGTGGTNGAAVAAATTLLEQEVLATIDTAVGEYYIPISYLPVPIRSLALLRVAARISTSITGGMAVSCGFTAMTNIGA